jgi:hypothetical protein
VGTVPEATACVERAVDSPRNACAVIEAKTTLEITATVQTSRAVGVRVRLAVLNRVLCPSKDREKQPNDHAIESKLLIKSGHLN